MGGSFFSSGPCPLNTPRMSPEVYQLVKARCQHSLRELYLCVASPIEGPDKKDHGDIDILVAWKKAVSTGQRLSARPTTASEEDTRQVEEEAHQVKEKARHVDEEARQAIKESIGAAHVISEKSGDHYAIPWPEDDIDTSRDESDASSRRHIQVDITICKDLKELQWILFKHAHGDLWSILGMIIRRYGLVVDEDSLWLRIPEIEANHEKTRAKIHLTSDTFEILNFLGLDFGTYWERRFDSLDDMYEYAATCRMFWVRPEGDVLPTACLSSRKLEHVLSAANVQGSETDRQKLRSKDRRRMSNRPAFSKFIDKFLPRCRAEGRFLKEPTTRETIRDEAFMWFGVGPVYTCRLNKFLCEKSEKSIWDEVKASLTVDANKTCHLQYRTCLLRALKKIIFEGDKSYGIVPQTALRGGSGLMIKDEVRRFVAEYSGEIGRRALEEHNRAWKEHLMKKEANSQRRKMAE